MRGSRIRTGICFRCERVAGSFGSEGAQIVTLFRLVVSAGAPHAFENIGRETAHLVVDGRPRAETTQSIEDGVALARTDKFTASGKPCGLRALFEAAALAHRYRETMIPRSPPPGVPPPRVAPGKL